MTNEMLQYKNIVVMSMDGAAQFTDDKFYYPPDEIILPDEGLVSLTENFGT